MKTFGYRNDIDIEDLPCKHLTSIPKCNVSDGARFRTLIAGNGKIIQSKFYAPESFEMECCPGNLKRKKFLRLKSAIDNSFPDSLKKTTPR